MNKKNVLIFIAFIVIVSAIILGLVFGLPTNTSKISTESSSEQSSQSPTPSPTPLPPPPSSFEDISNNAISDTQKLILKNTSFELFEIKLLIDLFNFNNDTITIKTSRDSNKQLKWNEVALTMTYTPEVSTFPKFTEAQAKLIKKIIVDNVEFNVTNNNFYSSYFAFLDLRLGKVFDKLINSYYKIDRFKIKYTDNSFSSSNLSFTSDSTSTKEMTLDLIKNELSTRLTGQILPKTASTIVINNKLILNVEYIPNEKRIDSEEKTGTRIFTIKKISEKSD